MNEIFTYFPDEIKQELMKYNLELLEEIRIRNGRKIFLKMVLTGEGDCGTLL